MMIEMKIISTTVILVVQHNQAAIINTNTSMRLFGSATESDVSKSNSFNFRYIFNRSTFLSLSFLFRKGDYFRYLAEFKTDSERKEASEQSLKGYEASYSLVD